MGTPSFVSCFLIVFLLHTLTVVCCSILDKGGGGESARITLLRNGRIPLYVRIFRSCWRFVLLLTAPLIKSIAQPHFFGGKNVCAKERKSSIPSIFQYGSNRKQITAMHSQHARNQINTNNVESHTHTHMLFHRNSRLFQYTGVAAVMDYYFTPLLWSWHLFR